MPAKTITSMDIVNLLLEESVSQNETLCVCISMFSLLDSNQSSTCSTHPGFQNRQTVRLNGCASGALTSEPHGKKVHSDTQKSYCYKNLPRLQPN
eukprot:3061613-Amphidinium_carterae.1